MAGQGRADIDEIDCKRSDLETPGRNRAAPEQSAIPDPEYDAPPDGVRSMPDVPVGVSGLLRVGVLRVLADAVVLGPPLFADVLIDAALEQNGH